MDDSSNLEDKYMIKNVLQNSLQDESFAPYRPPYTTLSTFGKYLTRIDGKNDFLNQKIEVYPKIIDNWANKNRAYWVDKCGTNDYYIHEIHKNYSYKTENYHPKNLPFKRLFPRPYNCEYDFIENVRLCGIENIDAKYQPPIFINRKAKGAESIKSCEFLPPFWWEPYKKLKEKLDPCAKVYPIAEVKVEPEPIRWKPKLNVVEMKQMTVCKRRDEMKKVGQPFYHEACMFYFENYPAPKLEIFPQRFCK